MFFSRSLLPQNVILAREVLAARTSRWASRSWLTPPKKKKKNNGANSQNHARQWIASRIKTKFRYMDVPGRYLSYNAEEAPRDSHTRHLDASTSACWLPTVAKMRSIGRDGRPRLEIRTLRMGSGGGCIKLSRSSQFGQCWTRAGKGGMRAGKCLIQKPLYTTFEASFNSSGKTSLVHSKGEILDKASSCIAFPAALSATGRHDATGRMYAIIRSRCFFRLVVEETSSQPPSAHKVHPGFLDGVGDVLDILGTSRACQHLVRLAQFDPMPSQNALPIRFRTRLHVM